MVVGTYLVFKNLDPLGMSYLFNTTWTKLISTLVKELSP